MKLIALITGGRNGSEFFQSLLDEHSEIMQFPGNFLFDDFYEKIKNEKNSNIIAQSFIRFETFSSFRFGTFPPFRFETFSPFILR